MVGHELRLRGRLLRERRLERARHARMRLVALGRALALVDRVADQGVAEAVLHRGRRLRDDHLRLGEPFERLREGRRVGHRDGIDHGERERVADGGRHLRHGLRRAEAFDATREQPLERRGKRRRHSRRGGDDPGSLAGALRHRQRQLLREERIAAGSGGDESGGIFVHARRRAQSARCSRPRRT